MRPISQAEQNKAAMPSADERVEGHRVVEHAPWSPAQAIVLAAGLVLVVIGGIALARTGLHFDNIPVTHAQAAGLKHTSLSAAIELGAGVILLGVGAIPGAARGPNTLFATLLLGAGLVIAIQPSSFHKWLGYDAGNGVFIAVIGAVLLVAAMVSPVIWGARNRWRVGGSPDVPGAGYRGVPHWP
jgi:hypothetical protein